MGSVRKLPSGNWQARAWNTVENRMVTIGSFRTKADANAQIRASETDMQRGKWTDPNDGKVLFGDYATAWLAGRNDLKRRTRGLYESLLRLYILPTFADVALVDIKPVAVRAWHSKIGAPTSSAPSAAPKAYRLLSTIMRTAVADLLIPVSPVHIKHGGRENSPERPTVTIGQAYALADAVHPRFRSLIILATFSGLRLGELRGLRLKHLDLDAQTVKVVGQWQEDGAGTWEEDPKSAAGRRTVALPDAVVEDMRSYVTTLQFTDPGDFVFPGVAPGGLRSNQDRSRPFSKHGFLTWWHKAVVTVPGVPGNLHLHDLRHTGNTLAAANASTKELMARMGHSTPSAALRYQHASAERDRAIAKALNDQITAARARPVGAAR